MGTTDYELDNGLVYLSQPPGDDQNYTVFYTGDSSDSPVAELHMDGEDLVELVGIYQGDPPFSVGEYEDILRRVESALGLEKYGLVDEGLERFESGRFLDGRQTV